MVHLGFLGGVVFERNGALVTGRAAQRHHAALLALLATSPRRNASRDKLIGYLWPEGEAALVRHRLSVALHVLRRGLGEDCIVTSGDALTLNLEAVHADVSAFIEAFQGGRLEEAVGHYAGPFLDGFFLSGAPEFEQWAETQRQRLGGMYRAALEGLIAEAEAENDTARTVGWCRRLVAHVPHSAPGAIRLLRALAAVGDVTGALRHARAHIAMGQAELELPPDPELLELMSQLQQAAELLVKDAPEHSAGPLMIATPVPGEEEATAGFARPPSRHSLRTGVFVVAAAVLAVPVVWSLPGATSGGGSGPGPSVVVTAFDEAEGGPESTTMGKALAERVRATLAFVPGLDVRSAGATPLAAGPPSIEESGSIVEGEIRRHGGRWRVTVRLFDGPGGEARWTGTWSRPAENEDLVLDELSLTIADELRLQLAPYEPRSYTENDRAYDRFLHGVHAQRHYTAKDTWVALQFYREAREEDPTFALAHAIAGNAYIALTGLGLSPEIGLELARQHVEEALALDSTLAEGHAALGQIQIWSKGDFEAGERSLRRAIMLYPTLPQARSWYARYALEVRGWNDVAVASSRRALEVDPLNTALSYSVEWVLYGARRYDEVEEQHRVTRAIGPEVARGFRDSPLGHAYRELGRYEESLAEFRALEERFEGPPPVGLALTYARMGREAEARAILLEWETAARDGRGSPVGVARIHAALGDLDAAFRWLDRAFESGFHELLGIRTDPRLDPIRGDPRYAELLRRTGLN